MKTVSYNEEEFTAIEKNKQFDEKIQGYYDRLFAERNLPVFERKSLRMKQCNEFWHVKIWRKEKYKNVDKVSLCMDKFCSNCKKVRQAVALQKYLALINEQRELGRHLYQVTLTVPNVHARDLQEAIAAMFKAYQYLNLYMSSQRKAPNITIHDDMKYQGDQERFDRDGDNAKSAVMFQDVGLVGALRSLEITYGRGWYHPHFHCLWVTDKPIFELENQYIHNIYSPKYVIDKKTGKEKKIVRLYSNAEVDLQKYWRLLYEGVKVNAKNFGRLKDGYSCQIAAAAEGTFLEMFKYITKGSSNEHKAMTYEEFVTLYDALLRRKQIQAYGCFYRRKDEPLLNELDVAMNVYNEILSGLYAKENPISRNQRLTEMRDEVDYTVISKSRVFRQVLKLMREI